MSVDTLVLCVNAYTQRNPRGFVPTFYKQKTFPDSRSTGTQRPSTIPRRQPGSAIVGTSGCYRPEAYLRRRVTFVKSSHSDSLAHEDLARFPAGLHLTPLESPKKRLVKQTKDPLSASCWRSEQMLPQNMGFWSACIHESWR